MTEPIIEEPGVGPWDGPWPDAGLVGERFDPELLRDGDRRNVVDRYRYWTRQAIVADLDQRRHPFHVAIENWQHDFNIGSVVRTANAFLAREVHIVGKRRWNRRGAMVTDRYQHVRHHDDLDALSAWARTNRLIVVGIDNLPGAMPLETYALPRDCVLLFGQEGPGLSDSARSHVDAVLSIAQFGSTRSINAGAAAAIAMHAWICQHAELPDE
jgi:tRNA G18 (ribose-2'-O)-methylase SpoU